VDKNEEIVIIIVDENGARFHDGRKLQNPKCFNVKNPYLNVIILVEEGIKLSEDELNEFFLTANKK